MDKLKVGARVRVVYGAHENEEGEVTGRGPAGSALVKLDSLPWPLPGFIVVPL